MKLKITLFLIILSSLQIFANIRSININKISNDAKLIAQFENIKANIQYYDHWCQEWNYDKAKNDIISMLKESYNNFSRLQTKNEDLYLLLGDISHFLYNLDVTEYYEIAISNFNLAAQSNPLDYRPQWFCGNHYTLSNNSVEAIESFKKALTMQPMIQDADFWNDYAYAAALAGMHSHCIYAMAKVRKISGNPGSYETQAGKAFYELITSVDRDSSYKKEDIWTADSGEKTIFTSRPLGLKLSIDTLWNVSVYDYQKHQSAFVIKPASIISTKKIEINYTIAILMKTADENENLSDYVHKFMSKYNKINKIDFSKKYENTLAFEITDNNQYQNMGGAHIYMIGVERNYPDNPGLILESPLSFSSNNSGDGNYYRLSAVKNRFKGRIFYLIILDSCEDIHQESYLIFKTFFEKQIILE